LKEAHKASPRDEILSSRFVFLIQHTSVEECPVIGISAASIDTLAMNVRIVSVPGVVTAFNQQEFVLPQIDSLATQFVVNFILHPTNVAAIIITIEDTLNVTIREAVCHHDDLKYVPSNDITSHD
jgi:hypothetical protein